MNALPPQRKYKFQFTIDSIFQQLSIVSSGVLFSMQVPSAIQIATGIFQADAAAKKFDQRIINVLIIVLLVVIALLLFCYYASRVSERMDENANTIYTSAWYGLPLPQQRYIINMISFAQEEHIFLGLKMFPCSLQSFVTVK